MVIDAVMLLFASNLHIYHIEVEIDFAYLIVIYHIIIYIKITKDLIGVIKSE
jgi:hypothetical protein